MRAYQCYLETLSFTTQNYRLCFFFVVFYVGIKYLIHFKLRFIFKLVIGIFFVLSVNQPLVHTELYRFNVVFFYLLKPLFYLGVNMSSEREHKWNKIKVR